MRQLPIFLILLLLLTACGAPAEPTTAPTEVNEPRLEAPTLEKTPSPSLLVTEWRGASEGNVLFPLDPASGKPLPGYTPISLGFSSQHAFSPDRETLAVISFPTESASHGSLLLIHLDAWKTQKFELEIKGWVHILTFSPDGKRLAVSHGDSNYQLTMIDVEKGTITAQSPVDSYVTRLKFTAGGDTLMLYSPTLNPEDRMTAAAPQVSLLDATDLTPRWSAALDEVHDGIFAKDETVTSANLHEPGMASYLSPALVFAPDGDVLYIVHADAEKLTTVDFERQTIKTMNVEPKLTWFERLLSMTAGVAHAKIADGTTRQAVASPDGRFLYVVGVNNSSFQDPQGNWQFEQNSLGLEIIDTRDGSRLERIDADTMELSISPDGRFLYLRNWGTSPKFLPWTEVFDITSQQVVARKDNVTAMPALLTNGDFVLVSTFSTGESSHHMSVLEPDGLGVLSEWTDSQYVGWLTTP